MSVYNTDYYLVKKAIDSVLNQDYQSFELIVLDDGSNEYLSTKIQHYCQLYQHKIIYTRHENCGQSNTINIGVRISHGKYIAIIDSDDEYKTNHLSACLQEMDSFDLVSSVTETIVKCEEDYFVPDKDNYKKKIHVDDCILFATLFGKRAVFLSLRFKDIYAADADFYQLASKIYRVKKLNLRTYIYNRSNSNSISATLKKSQLT